MKIIAFFNNKGGVGKTTLVYHLAWMFQELGVQTVALDLDPQANLTAAFLQQDDLERIWAPGDGSATVYNFVEPFVEEENEERQPKLYEIDEGLVLVPGDLALSRFEDRLAEVWGKCLDGKAAAFKATSAFFQLATKSAQKTSADLVLMDLGPSLGALNRAALVAADHLVIPLAADLFSLQALRNVGPTLSRWRSEWTNRSQYGPPGLSLPVGRMQAAGYILLQHAVREDRPVKAYARWADRIPPVYHHEILGLPDGAPLPDPDPNRLALLKHYRSLMPLAQDARKPMFDLRAADGAIGAHAQAVQDCGDDFERLARRIAAQVAISIPSD